MTWSLNKNWRGCSAISIWLLSIAVGLWYLGKYETTPGAVNHRSPSWPVDHHIRLTPGRTNIVMLAHPRCPCTRASLIQLETLLDHCRGQINAHVFFWTPKSASADWFQTDLWRQAMAIPGVQVHADENGARAHLLGVATSGHVLVYSGGGVCLFSGGLTDARGQSGESLGVAIVEKLISGSPVPVDNSNVFGCPLFDPETSCMKGAEPCPK